MIDNYSVIKGDGYIYYRNSLISPMAAMLDDIYESVTQYVDHLMGSGFNILLTKEPDIIISTYKKNKNHSLYSFDTKMKGVPHKILGRNTFRGAATGPAVVCGLTNDGDDENIEFCASLTEHNDIDEANKTYAALEGNGQHIYKVMKSESIDDFVNFTNMYTDKYISSIKYDIMNKGIEAVDAAFSEISKEEDFNILLPNLMGFVGVDADQWNRKRNEALNLGGQDLKDRIEKLRYIKEGLMNAIGEDNIEDQTIWMYQKNKSLGGKSVWDLLETGKIDDLRIAVTHVNRILG